MTKLEQLQSMVEKWRENHSITMAYEICDFLYENLNLEDDDTNVTNMHDHHGWARKDGDEHQG